MKKFIILLLFFLFSLSAYGAKGGNPLFGKWESTNGKNNLEIYLDEKNQILYIENNKIKYNLIYEDEKYFYENDQDEIYVDLNKSRTFQYLYFDNSFIFLSNLYFL